MPLITSCGATFVFQAYSIRKKRARARKLLRPRLCGSRDEGRAARAEAFSITCQNAAIRRCSVACCPALELMFHHKLSVMDCEAIVSSHLLCSFIATCKMIGQAVAAWAGVLPGANVHGLDCVPAR